MSDDAVGDTLGDAQLQTEVLELLYWLAGEGFAADGTLPGLLRFLSWPEQDVSRVLARLIERGDIQFDNGVYTLTEIGKGDAARRFADDFAELMKHGHGECDDPDCDCHDNPLGAAECRGHHA